MIRTLSSRVVYENPWLKLREDVIERPGGQEGIYAVIEKPRAALVIPWDGERVHLIGQYRHTVKRESWEFPQGAVHENVERTPEEVARLELAQETGLRAGTLTGLGSFTFAIGASSQWCDCFLATELQQGDPEPEPEEVGLRTQALSISELEVWLIDGSIFDAASLAAWQLLMLNPSARAKLRY